MEKLLPDIAANSLGSAVTAERYRPYPAYRDSGVEWLGDIPEHWDVKRLKEFATVQLSNVDKKTADDEDAVQLCNYVDVYYNHKIGRRIEFMPATATPSQIRRFSLRTGDILITKDSETWTDIAVPAVVMEDLPGVLCGYHLAHIRPHEKHDGFFLAHCIAAVGPRDQYHVAANGITRFGLTGDAIRNGTLAIPPLVEQRRIAAFLDFETEKVDALVAQKERLIELLQEKRTALITRAVTKGIDPDAPMKDSGVQWMGEIPSHWSVRRLKRISHEISVGVVVNPSSYISEEGVPFVYGSDIREGSVAAEIPRKMNSEQSILLSKSQLNAGDLVVVRVGAPGVTAVISTDLEGANCASVVIVRGENSFDSNWLCYVMNSRIVRYQVTLVQYGAAQEQFNVAHAVEFMVPTPPLGEQNELSEFLDRETTKLDDLIANIRKSIDRFNELRIALISAAVTGKIDVREKPT